MTLHTKAATDEIYDLFNAPLNPVPQEEEESDEEDAYETDGDYTSGAESTGTTRQIHTSEADDDETSDVKSVSEWSDFTAQKHIPNVLGDVTEEESDKTHEVSDLIDTSNPEPSRPLSEPSEAHMSELSASPPDEVVVEEVEEVDEIVTPIQYDLEQKTAITFVPIPPEDYEPRTRPYRDSVERANNRLPFMTPITERTESSLRLTERKEQYKTPSKNLATLIDAEEDTTEPLSSPLLEVLSEGRSGAKFAQPLLQKTAKAVSAKPGLAKLAVIPKGPIIKDTQCNPVEESVRAEILANMHPPLSSYTGFYDHRKEMYEKGSEIRKYAKVIAKTKAGSDKTGSMSSPVVIQFPDFKTEYMVKKEIGAGAFAPVYLVENMSPEEQDADGDGGVAMGKGAFAVCHRSELEALKMETPPTPWEFHMMRLAHVRLGAQHRAAASISYAHEMHLYQDEGFLFLPYHPHGTLLDVVNFFRTEPSGVMDEQLAMFFTIELLRTVEALHAKGIMHGDLKADNCLLRLDSSVEPGQLASQWRADGLEGWSSRGITLIDFGRGIDMRNFVAEVQFIADWKTTAQDCNEMHEGRPWTWQIDYHGLAGTIHTLLFGRYIETVRCDSSSSSLGPSLPSGRRYRIRESLKRYWQTQLWGDLFDLLLNPAAFAAMEDGGKMPLLKGMKGVREGMEVWLEGNCERGVGLRGLVGKVEGFAKGRK
jgi:checkpoint serine/threonine-protein kinase